MKAKLCAACFVVLAISSAGAEDIVRKMDVHYAEAPAGTDAKLLSLDIYAPRDAKSLPVMIYIHGGGWRKGDKGEVDAKPEYFTARGFVFVSINYRLVPGVDIITQLQDSANAIGWVSAHITEHGGDPARLHLIGHSAGGHHVALLGTNERFLKKAGVPLDRLKSVVELDVEALDVPKVMNGGDERRTTTFGTDEKVWREVSPFHNVARGKGVPPFFIVVTGRAAADRVAAKLAQSQALQAALRAADVRCELVEAPQHDHNSLNRAIGVREDSITQAMEKFHGSITATARQAADPTEPPQHPLVGQRFVPEDVDWQHPVYANSFDKEAALADWKLEGGKRMSIENGRLVLENDPAIQKNHLVCWLVKELPGDFLLEFKLRPRDRKEGLNIVFFNTRGLGGENIFDPALAPRNGDFKQYHSGDLNGYHISYWAGNRGTANVRKNKGFALVATGPDLVVKAAEDAWQTIRLYKRGGTIRLMVDDVISVAFDDDGKSHGPVWTHSGWIGLRQMAHTVRCEYDDLEVFPLLP